MLFRRALVLGDSVLPAGAEQRAWNRHNLGLAALESGDERTALEQAKALLRESWSTWAPDIAMFVLRAAQLVEDRRVAVELGEFAFHQVDRTLTSPPKWRWTCFALARILTRAGDYERARQVAAIGLDEDGDGNVRTGTSGASVSSGGPYRCAPPVEIDGVSAWLATVAGWTEFVIGDHEAARALFTRARASAPDAAALTSATLGISAVSIESGRIAQATSACQEVLRADSGNAAALQHLALLALRLGRPTRPSTSALELGSTIRSTRIRNRGLWASGPRVSWQRATSKGLGSSSPRRGKPPDTRTSSPTPW